MFGHGSQYRPDTLKLRLPATNGAYIPLTINVFSAFTLLLLVVHLLGGVKLVSDSVDDVLGSRRNHRMTPMSGKRGHVFL